MISVIIPVYNVEKYLDTCITSVVNQTYTNLEIILINDGSTDSSGDICNNWAKIDKRIIVEHKKNGGLADARNKGLDIASGEYIFFLDSDDWLDLNALEILVSQIENTDIDMIIFNLKKVIDEKTEGVNNKFELNEGVYTKLEVLAMFEKNIIPLVTACSKIYNKKIFDNIRFPIGRINEDEFTAHFIIDECNKIMIINKPLYYYRQTPNSIMSNIKGVKLVDVLIAYKERVFLLKRYNLDAAEKNQLENFYITFKYRYPFLALGNDEEKKSAKIAYENFLELKILLKKQLKLNTLKDKAIWILLICMPKLYVWIFKSFIKEVG